MEKSILLTIGILVGTLIPACAQPGDPGGDPGGAEPVPLGATEILLAAGALLGMRKVIDIQKRRAIEKRLL